MTAELLQNPSHEDTERLVELRGPLRDLVSGADLSPASAGDVMQVLIDGRFTPAQFGALAVALRMKGEKGHEVSAFVERLRAHSTRVTLAPGAAGAVDMCGTGGDGPSAHVFNISTTAAFVVAGAGAPVAKHGTSAVSSDSGSTDVLQALGVRASMTADDAAACLQELGITYMHAPSFNSGMRHLIRLRREIGLRFVFNLLGPLCNPARVRRQITGIYDARYLPVVADALLRLGSERAWVVHARDGLDELSTRTVTDVHEVVDGRVVTREVDPAALGLTAAPLEELAGGDPARNAEITRSVLAGTATRARTEVVLLNAAAALVVAGRADDLPAGLDLAERSVRDGAALDVLRRWQERSAVEAAPC